MIKQTPSPARIIAMVAFAMSCFGILLFLWLTFGGSVPLKPQEYRVHVLFPNATTLADEADVRISGVNVGKVKAKTVKPALDRTDVVLELDHRYAPISRDAHAILRQKTLLGETYVELAPGSRRAPKLRDGGTLGLGNVAPTVQLDDIFRAFDPKTRAAFQRWMMSQGRVFQGRGQALNEAIGNLAPFAEDTTTLLQVLDENHADLRELIRNTGDVFSALTERRGQLRSLIVNSNRVFATTAQRDRELQDTFRVLPTFLAESRRTLTRVTAFANNTNPLVTQLRPAARQLSPTLIQLEGLAPDLRALFRDIGPLVRVSRAGLPATSDFLDQLRPLLDSADPFLRNLNPIVSYLGLYKHEITQFFANDVASTEAQQDTGSGVLHYLRTTNPLNPENLAIYPHRPSTNRSNPYVDPLGYMKLATKGHLDVFGSYLCTSNPVPTLGPLQPLSALTQDVLGLVQTYAYGGNGPVPAPPCTAQQPLGTYIGQSGVYPHVAEESP